MLPSITLCNINQVGILIQNDRQITLSKTTLEFRVSHSFSTNNQDLINRNTISLTEGVWIIFYLTMFQYKVLHIPNLSLWEACKPWNHFFCFLILFTVDDRSHFVQMLWLPNRFPLCWGIMSVFIDLLFLFFKTTKYMQF